MAIVKHIKSRNANYSDALNYLIFQHDESTGKMILDEFNRPLRRDELYVDGLNCNPDTFDVECYECNEHFKKNRSRSEIKSHHYIISFDPDDKSECGLTGEKAQALSLELAKKIFPGYQALIVTHTDGHNGSGNIHTHIVINSVRKEAVKRLPYMDKPHEEIAGYKHRSTNKFLNYFKKEIMDMCIQEGLHQVDLLSPAETKITQAEYMAQKSGQKKLEETNKKIIADGLKPTATTFQTQKQELRNAIEECSSHSKSFQEFQSLLFEKYQISVIEERGRYRYLHPDRDKRITEKALGTQYGKEHLEQLFSQKDPITILYVRSHLRLVLDLQKNVKAMQSPGYAHRVKISNLQEMANTIIYVQEHGYNTQTELKNAFSESQKQLDQATDQLMEMNADLKSINRQIHYTGQYFAQKALYTEFLKAKNKGRFRKEHTAEIQAYEEARDWLKSFYPDGKMHSIKTLKEQKARLQEQINRQKSSIQSLKDLTQDLKTVDKNVEAILHNQVPKKQRTQEPEL